MTVGRAVADVARAVADAALALPIAARALPAAARVVLDDQEADPVFDRSAVGAHTYARGSDQYPEDMAPVIARGSGARVEDVDGNTFVEYGMGLRAVTLGHGTSR